MEMQYKEVRDLVREEILSCQARQLKFTDTTHYIHGFIKALIRMGVLKSWDEATFERLLNYKNTLICMWFE